MILKLIYYSESVLEKQIKLFLTVITLHVPSSSLLICVLLHCTAWPLNYLQFTKEASDPDQSKDIGANAPLACCGHDVLMWQLPKYTYQIQICKYCKFLNIFNSLLADLFSHFLHMFKKNILGQKIFLNPENIPYIF